MENLNLFLDYIARTNLFNFVIFLSIIILLLKKINIVAKLETMKQNVEASIQESISAKEQSEEHLNSVEKSVKNVRKEIDLILKRSEENANLIGTKILQDAEQLALSINENSEKVIENNLFLLRNDLIKRASVASIEVAKMQILKELSNNNELHDKLINESIEALDICNEKIEEV